MISKYYRFVSKKKEQSEIKGQPKSNNYHCVFYQLFQHIWSYQSEFANSLKDKFLYVKFDAIYLDIRLNYYRQRQTFSLSLKITNWRKRKELLMVLRWCMCTYDTICITKWCRSGPYARITLLFTASLTSQASERQHVWSPSPFIWIVRMGYYVSLWLVKPVRKEKLLTFDQFSSGTTVIYTGQKIY